MSKSIQCRSDLGILLAQGIRHVILESFVLPLLFDDIRFSYQLISRTGRMFEVLINACQRLAVNLFLSLSIHSIETDQRAKTIEDRHSID